MSSYKNVNDCWNKIGVWAMPAQRTCERLKNVVHCANCEIFSNAGKQLLDKQAPQGYLEEWAGLLAKEQEEKSYAPCSAILFRLGDEWLGIDTALLDEVIPIKAVHKVPHRKNKVLKGLANVRGELQLCVSLGRLMHITRGEMTGNNVIKGIYERMLVIANEGVKYVFPVSEVRSVHRYNKTDLQDVPATAMNCSIHYLKGMLEIDGRHVGVIDHKLLFSALESGIY